MVVSECVCTSALRPCTKNLQNQIQCVEQGQIKRILLELYVGAQHTKVIKSNNPLAFPLYLLKFLMYFLHFLYSLCSLYPSLFPSLPLPSLIDAIFTFKLLQKALNDASFEVCNSFFIFLLFHPLLSLSHIHEDKCRGGASRIPDNQLSPIQNPKIANKRTGIYHFGPMLQGLLGPYDSWAYLHLGCP